MEINIPQSRVGKEPVKIKVVFPTNAYFLSGIRDFTLQIVKNMSGFPDQWAFRFQSVVDELCNNAIEHGSTPGKDIVLCFAIIRHERLEVSVTDTGTGPSKMKACELQKILEERRTKDPMEIFDIRGRGLSHIIAPLTDEIYFEDNSLGGIDVKVVKFFHND